MTSVSPAPRAVGERISHGDAPGIAAPHIVHVVGNASRGGCEANSAVFIENARHCEHHVVVLGCPGPMTEVWRSFGATVSHHYSLDRGWLAFRRRMRALWRVLPKDGAILWAGIRLPLLLDGSVGIGAPAVIHAGNPFTPGPRVRTMLALADIFIGRAPTKVSVIACSQHVAASLRRSRYFRRFPIEVCLNPVAVPENNPHVVRDLNPSAEVHLGMVARLDPIKDHAIVLRAVALLRARWPRVRLHLAGDGVLRAPLEALAHELGIADAVTFHGVVADVPAFLRRLDVFVYGTTEREGMGNALAEAMAHGLPCVVSDLPVMREVVGESPTACCVSPGAADVWADVIDEILCDASKRQRLSGAVFARAGRVFSGKQVVEHYLRALQLTG